MDYYLGVLQTIGVHTLLGLSAYILLLTGQVSMAQIGFFAIGAYSSGVLTVIFSWHIYPALAFGAFLASFFAFLVGFPALRVKGLMLVIATIAFSEIVRLITFNFVWMVEKDGIMVGADGAHAGEEGAQATGSDHHMQLPQQRNTTPEDVAQRRANRHHR